MRWRAGFVASLATRSNVLPGRLRNVTDNREILRSWGLVAVHCQVRCEARSAKPGGANAGSANDARQRASEAVYGRVCVRASLASRGWLIVGLMGSSLLQAM